MGKTAAAKAEARFKQLCCLGLGGEAVMPALIDELRALVPSTTSTFFFADDRGDLANIYEDAQDSPVMIRLYMEEFHRRPDRLLPGFDFSESMLTQSGVLDWEAVSGTDMNAFRRSEFYNIFYRHNRWDAFVRLIVRDPGRKLGKGRLTLHRGPGEAAFTPEEKRRIAALGPFLAHALERRNDGKAALVDSGKSGVIVADQAGKPIHLSAEGRRLLFLASHPGLGRETVFSGGVALPEPLVQVCRNLHRVFVEDASSSTPAYHMQNAWGGFTFRAHWLEGEDPAGGLIAITISHREPLAIAMIRRVGKLALSRRQAEVCVLMATGVSNEVIAERLGISRHTAVAHGRWIYDKLDVHNRTELVNRLLSV
jgi:DNA-binding CsgD family transcriptional regulator